MNKIDPKTFTDRDQTSVLVVFVMAHKCQHGNDLFDMITGFSGSTGLTY